MNKSKRFTCATESHGARGFTIIELLVAASILSFIGMAILTAFASGLRVYERVQSYGSISTDAVIILEEIEKKLRNVFFYSAIGFEGGGQYIAFPVLLETVETVDERQHVITSIGRVAYYLEKNGGEEQRLMRQEQDYAQATQGLFKAGDGQGAYQVAVKNLEFSYWKFDQDQKQYAWQDTWVTNEGLPAGVKITLTYRQGDGDVQLARTVLIPCAQKGQEEEQTP